MSHNFFIVSQEESGLRVDKLLFQHFAGEQSRAYFQKLIHDQLVLVNGETVKKRLLSKEGDEIEVEFSYTPEIKLSPEAIDLDVLYEDDAVLVVNKPPGMVVHPAAGNWSGTFVNALLYHCKGALTEDATLRPGIVHRLDKETSGCLIAAKNLCVQQQLIAQFAARDVEKEYIAVSVGHPGNGLVDAPIGRHPVNRKKMAVVETGRAARSHFEVIANDGKCCVVRIDLETGRTHQARVHLLHKKAPVLGDHVYGKESSNQHYGVKRQLLHAYLLTFTHPETKEKMTIKAPLPEDMKKQIKKIDPGLVL